MVAHPSGVPQLRGEHLLQSFEPGLRVLEVLRLAHHVGAPHYGGHHRGLHRRTNVNIIRAALGRLPVEPNVGAVELLVLQTERGHLLCCELIQVPDDQLFRHLVASNEAVGVAEGSEGVDLPQGAILHGVPRGVHRHAAVRPHPAVEALRVVREERRPRRGRRRRLVLEVQLVAAERVWADAEARRHMFQGRLRGAVQPERDPLLEVGLQRHRGLLGRRGVAIQHAEEQQAQQGSQGQRASRPHGCCQTSPR
mmetsp:Transcript_54183/g.143880  ORF Transcript_54183/g.143880 Transcript_54183/m.143880 type:complete len:252 (+) Transcript_54183:978-1733(+)